MNRTVGKVAGGLVLLGAAFLFAYSMMVCWLMMAGPCQTCSSKLRPECSAAENFMLASLAVGIAGAGILWTTRRRSQKEDGEGGSPIG